MLKIMLFTSILHMYDYILLSHHYMPEYIHKYTSTNTLHFLLETKWQTVSTYSCWALLGLTLLEYLQNSHFIGFFWDYPPRILSHKNLGSSGLCPPRYEGNYKQYITIPSSGSSGKYIPSWNTFIILLTNMYILMMLQTSHQHYFHYGTPCHAILLANSTF